jgi:hypothetical protein
MMHKETLLTAARIIDQRGAEYGDMRETHERIARLFNDMVPDVKLEAQHVAAVLIATKLARLFANPSHADSYVDLAAYTAFRSELIEEKAAPVAFKPPKPLIPTPRVAALDAIQNAIGSLEE